MVNTFGAAANRVSWARLITDVVAQVKAHGDGRAIAMRLAGATASGFPVAGDSAAMMAGAFLSQARAYAQAELPEWRELYAGAVRASAEALEGLMHLQRCAEAEPGRRVMGERD